MTTLKIRNETNTAWIEFPKFDPTLTLTAGSYLSGGGDLTTDRIFNFEPSLVSHTLLADIGANTHADIDNHIAATDNPHSVTAAQVGKDTAQWNASKLQGYAIATTAPTDGYALKWNAGASQWEPGPVATQLSGLSDVGSVSYTAGYVLRADGTDFDAAQLQHSDLGGVGSSDHHTYPIPTAGLADDAVTVDKLAHDIDASGIGFNAAKLGGYAASDFPRKAENATVTGSWDFTANQEFKNLGAPTNQWGQGTGEANVRIGASWSGNDNNDNTCFGINLTVDNLPASGNPGFFAHTAYFRCEQSGYASNPSKTGSLDVLKVYSYACGSQDTGLFTGEAFHYGAGGACQGSEVHALDCGSVQVGALIGHYISLVPDVGEKSHGGTSNYGAALYIINDGRYRAGDVLYVPVRSTSDRRNCAGTWGLSRESSYDWYNGINFADVDFYRYAVLIRAGNKLGLRGWTADTYIQGGASSDIIQVVIGGNEMLRWESGVWHLNISKAAAFSDIRLYENGYSNWCGFRMDNGNLYWTDDSGTTWHQFT